MANDSDKFQVFLIFTSHLASDIDNEQQGAQPLRDNQQVCDCN